MSTIADRLLEQIDRRETTGQPTNKSAITEGLNERTAARRWQTIEKMVTQGWLYRVWPASGPAYFRLTPLGTRHLTVLNNRAYPKEREASK